MLYQIKVSRCVKENIKQILNCPRNQSIRLVMYHQRSLFCKSNIIIISLLQLLMGLKNSSVWLWRLQAVVFLGLPKPAWAETAKTIKSGARGSQSFTLVSLLNSLVLETMKYFILFGASGTVFLANDGFSHFKQNLLGLTFVSDELFCSLAYN